MVKTFFRKWWRLFLVAALLAAAIQFFVRPPGFSPEHGIGEIGTALFRPVYKAVDFLRRGISSVWSGDIGLGHGAGENAEFRKDLEVLQEKLKESRDAVLENERLEELLRFSKTLEKRTIGARIVGDDVSPRVHGVFIDAGSGVG